MFNIVDYPPGLGECSFCKKHTCGTKEDGTQQWLHSPIELHVGNDLTIGYQCAKMIMDGFELTVRVVEKPIYMTPTDEQIGDFVRKAVNQQGSSIIIEGNSIYEPHPSVMNREQLKTHLRLKNIEFIPQWGEERLREEALKHV